LSRASPTARPALEPIPPAERHLRPPQLDAQQQLRSATTTLTTKAATASSRSSPPSCDANCAHCYAPLRVGLLQESVVCTHCHKRNVAVQVVVASAECECGGRAVRRAGTDALLCGKCSRATREAACTRCGTRFVYPAQWPSPFLPCASNCGVKMSIAEATVAPERVRHRSLLRELAPPRSAAACGGADVAAVAGGAWLCVQAYVDSDARRLAEMDACLAHNLDNVLVRGVFLPAESSADAERFRRAFAAAVASGRLVVLDHGRRLLISEAFALLNDEPRVAAGDLCAVANSDVFFDESLGALLDDPMRNVVLAQSRHDVLGPDVVQYDQFVAPMAQDAWIYRKDRVPCLRRVTRDAEAAARADQQLLARVERGELPPSVLLADKVPNRASLSHAGIGRHFFGLPGSDNRLAADLRARAVQVLNQPRTVRVLHLHASQVRRYEMKKTGAAAAQVGGVDPPYAPVMPSNGGE
jgi:hypothetical protein